MPKLLRIAKTDDISQIILRIKNSREKELVLDAEKGAAATTSSANLRLIRKTAEVLGKSVSLKTSDPVARVLAGKAEMELYGEDAQPSARQTPRSLGLNRSGLSDIRGRKRVAVNRPADDDDGEGLGEKMKNYGQAIAAPVRGILNRLPLKRAEPMTTMPTLRTAAAPKSRTLSVASARRIFGNKLITGIAGALVLIIILGLGAIILLPKAQITVYARSEPITRDMEITVDRTVNSTDSAKQVIPGEIISKELSDTKTFQTTGTRDVGEKADGNVVLFNFTKNTLTLRAATTTLVINGKKYFFAKDVTGLRPTGRIGSGEEQEIDRTTLIAPVPIIAENPGDTYNLSPNQKFTIQNAALGTTTEVYAINETAITGGSSRTLKILAQADIDRATAQMTEELATIAEQELGKESNSATKVLPTGSNKEILAKTANKNVGDETAEFDMTIIGRLTGLAYSEDDITGLLTEKINAVLTADKYLLPESKKQVTARFKSIDLAAGKGVLVVHFETVVAYRIDSDGLSRVLAGKTANEIKEILWTKPEIDKVDVRFSPFFVNKAPRYNGKIFIETVMSES